MHIHYTSKKLMCIHYCAHTQSFKGSRTYVYMTSARIVPLGRGVKETSHYSLYFLLRLADTQGIE